MIIHALSKCILTEHIFYLNMLFLFSSHLTVGWAALCFCVIHLPQSHGCNNSSQTPCGILFFKVKATSPIQYSHNKPRIYIKCHTYSMANWIKWGSADILYPRAKRSRSILQCFVRTPLWLILRILMWECTHIFTFGQMLN